MGRFERYLSLWVALGIAAGVGLGLLVQLHLAEVFIDLRLLG